MTSVRPEAGISYSYLWFAESREGHEEGYKDCPRLIVGVEPGTDAEARVVVLPITHSPPADPSAALEMPESIRRHLRLDDGRCWLMLDEANEFQWPGPDLRRNVPGGTVVYERVPPRYFAKVKQQLVAFVRAGRTRRVKRTEQDLLSALLTVACPQFLPIVMAPTAPQAVLRV